MKSDTCDPHDQLLNNLLETTVWQESKNTLMVLARPKAIPQGSLFLFKEGGGQREQGYKKLNSDLWKKTLYYYICFLYMVLLLQGRFSN